MTTPEQQRQEMDKTIAEWEKLMTDFPFAWEVCKEAGSKNGHHEDCSWRKAGMLCDCAAEKAFIYTVDKFRSYTKPIAAYIRSLQAERDTLREWIIKNCTEKTCKNSRDDSCTSCQAWNFLDSLETDRSVPSEPLPEQPGPFIC